MISPHCPPDGIGSQGVFVNPVYWQEDGDRIKAGPIWGDRPVLIKDLRADVDNKVVPLHHNQAALQTGFCVAFEFFPLDARFGLRR